jgi:hypothetical protein
MVTQESRKKQKEKKTKGLLWGLESRKQREDAQARLGFRETTQRSLIRMGQLLGQQARLHLVPGAIRECSRVS